MEQKHETYWEGIWRQFKGSYIGLGALGLVGFIGLIGLYAPFLASSKPIVVSYRGEIYFPLFRYLFFTGFFTKPLDLFFNLFMFLFPLMVLGWFFGRNYRRWILFLIVCTQFLGSGFLWMRQPFDPAVDPNLQKERQEKIQKQLTRARSRGEALPPPSWDFELSYMNPYARLNEVLRYVLRKRQHEAFESYQEKYREKAYQDWLSGELRKKQREYRGKGLDIPEREILVREIEEQADSSELNAQLALPTLWQLDRSNEEELIQEMSKQLEVATPQRARYLQAKIDGIVSHRKWLEDESHRIGALIMPLLRPFHWEDDAGGEQDLNRFVDWWELTRVNRKDLVAALIFGVRISFFVGLTSMFLALVIGIPIGGIAGYYGGKIDIVISRLMEIWESMPVFFMLLMIVAVTQSKSIFLVIGVIGLFGWTGFGRYIRGEFFKQRNLSYVTACHAMGFRDGRIIFGHILPNAIPPLLTLLPFSIMGAMTSEAGLSFLGLGEEGSCSWGVLMDEGRTAFPGESYLLWPPAIVLTILLIAIALVGDVLRDSLDPKLKN